MRRILILLLIICCVSGTVNAMEFTAPQAPDSAEKYMPEDTQSFGKGLWYVVKSAIAELQPNLKEAGIVCFSIIAMILLVSLLRNFSGNTTQVTALACAVVIGILLIKPSNSLIQLGLQTVEELSEYGKLLLPVMTAAMAAGGGSTTSAVLYTGTVFFDTLLSIAISKLLVPMIYIYMVLCVACSAIGEELLKNLRSFVKWLMTWTLRILLYTFTGYIGITGVVSGHADAAAIKATKLTISGVVPVVGNIISDASETILVSAGIMRSSVGVYGLLAIVAMWIGPFLLTGTQYLLLKLTTAICGVFGEKKVVDLVKDFTWIMGFVVAMTGTVCLLLLISIVCFMKGVG